MAFKFHSNPPVIATAVLACMTAVSAAADNRPPAGQMCPEGAYVIGFDAASNIVCSPIAAPAQAQAQAAGHDVTEAAGDACPAGCKKETQEAKPVAGGEAAGHLADRQVAAAAGGGPVIDEIKPRWVVFGARETTIRIIGSGFNAGTTVRFRGAAYTPSVNDAGTELRVTIETRDLPMGRFAITVANGDGLETTRNRALEVF